MKKLAWVLIWALSIAFVVPWDYAFAACTAGTRYALPSTYGGSQMDWGSNKGLWRANGSGDSGNVPKGMMPSGRPSGVSSYNAAGVTVSSIGCSCSPSGVQTGYNATGWYYYECSGTQDGCAAGTTIGVTYSLNWVANYGTDYDCDGVGDSTDQYPTYAYDDSDGDNVPDVFDPWPSDPALPGSALFSKVVQWVRTSDGKTVTLYAKSDDPMNEDYWWFGSSDSSVTYSDVQNNPGDWSENRNIYTGESKTFGDWANYNVQTGAGFNSLIQSSAQAKTDTGRSSGGDSGSSSPSSGSTADYQTMFDYLQGIQRNTSDSAKNTGAVVDALNQIGKNQGGISDLLKQIRDKPSGGSEVNIDLSTTNSKLDSIKESVDDLTDIGNVGDLPSGDASGMQDNTDIQGENLTALEDTAKETFGTWLDDYFGAENPLRSLVQGSGVTSSGGACVGGLPGGGELCFDGAENALSAIGVFWVAFCGLAGLVEFLRG